MLYRVRLLAGSWMESSHSGDPTGSGLSGLGLTTPDGSSSLLTGSFVQLVNGAYFL